MSVPQPPPLLFVGTATVASVVAAETPQPLPPLLVDDDDDDDANDDDDDDDDDEVDVETAAPHPLTADDVGAAVASTFGAAAAEPHLLPPPPPLFDSADGTLLDDDDAVPLAADAAGATVGELPQPPPPPVDAVGEGTVVVAAPHPPAVLPTTSDLTVVPPALGLCVVADPLQPLSLPVSLIAVLAVEPGDLPAAEEAPVSTGFDAVADSGVAPGLATDAPPQQLPLLPAAVEHLPVCSGSDEWLLVSDILLSVSGLEIAPHSFRAWMISFRYLIWLTPIGSLKNSAVPASPPRGAGVL